MYVYKSSYENVRADTVLLHILTRIYIDFCRLPNLAQFAKKVNAHPMLADTVCVCVN